MQLSFFAAFTALVTAPEAPAAPVRVLTIDGRDYQIVIARHRRARRYVLRMAGRDTLRLTVPRGASIAGGLRFAERQAAWIAREQGRHCERIEAWRDGTRLWFRGEHVPLHVRADRIALGDDIISRSPEEAHQEDRSDVRAVVEAHLTELARRELPLRAAELAAEHRLDVVRWSIRNQRSRWGSCSPRRVITLNWRLVQMPASVCDYVILHELMHLRQPNHSRRFWREVESVCSWWRDAERWLKQHGRDIL